jgi:DNA-binding NtrC family response regulator
MFDLKRLVHMGKSGRREQTRQIHGTSWSTEPVKLVVITQNSGDTADLRRIAGNYGWRISIVGSSDAAITVLNEQPAPVVICDRDLPGEAWHEVLAKIAALPQAVCVLVASRVVDDYLWRQVIRHHGYDVVSKPFQPEELRRAVVFAWSWRGWAHRHYTEVLGKPTA